MPRLLVVRADKEQTMSTKPFAAEVLFLDPAEVPHAVAALASCGCNYVKDPDDRDEAGSTELGMVTGQTELPLNAIGPWLNDIIDRFGGDVVEWDYGPAWK
jgi:hypothetical protein